MKAAVLLMFTFVLAACGSVSKQGTSPLSQHDLGSVFESGAAKSPVGLRSIAVVAHPMINSVAMQYREVAVPTRRNVWTSNRWAAPPAAMTEGALNRLLANSGAPGRCRLLVTLGEFIVEIDAAGKAEAVVVADLRLTSDGGQSQQLALDLRAPLSQAAPVEAALAFRRALQQLGERTSAWLGGPAGQVCKG